MDIQAPGQKAQQAAIKMRAAAQKKRQLQKRIIFGIVAAVLALAVLFGIYSKYINTGIKKDQYQAVFLTNGQVYFGKLSNPNSKYISLEDVYYLQVQDSKAADGQSQDSAEQLQQGEPQLIKLGEELHGPEDVMKVSQSQVTFWENLKSDSKVVKAIEQYKKK